MTKHESTAGVDLNRDLQIRIRPFLGQAPWVLRITENKDKPVPVFVVKERLFISEYANTDCEQSKKSVWKDRGLLYGQSLRRCLPVIRSIIGGVRDTSAVPLDLQRYLGNGRISFRGNMPLDEEAGAKLALIFKLQERVGDLDRVELMAWRVERFSREEAVYWLSRITQYGEPANRWAMAGMRLMLGGQPGDSTVQTMLDKLRR